MNFAHIFIFWNEQSMLSLVQLLYEIIAAGAARFIWVYSSFSTPFAANCRAAGVKNNLINAHSKPMR